MLESDLSRESGIPRKALSRFRSEQLIEDVDWRLGKNAAVELLESGVESVSRAFKVDVAGIHAKTRARAQETLIVDSLPRNRRILMAVRKMYSAEKMRVEVRSSDGFRPGVEIDCEHVKQDLWRFVGRYPRNKRKA